MLVVMTVAAVMLGMAVSTIHLLLRAEHEATNSARYAASAARLAHVFRDDLHFAREVELPAAQAGEPAVLIARTETGRRIRYELDAHRATRIEGNAAAESERSNFYFPPDSQLAFERVGNSGLLRLAIDMPRAGFGPGADPASAAARPMQRLAIEAAPARWHRRATFGGDGEKTIE